MITVPVHFKLHAADTVCSFNLALSFVVMPTIGHKIIFDEEDFEFVTVDKICHFVANEPSCLVMTEPLLFEEYDALLRRLDWFKALHTITDVRSNQDARSYYVFYRNLVNLLELKSQPWPVVTDPEVVCAGCVKLVAAEGRHLADLTTLRELAQLGRPLFEVIKRWEPTINKHGWQWSAAVS